MKTIKYYNGKTTMQVETTEKVAQAYQEIKRSEWRQEKMQQRYEIFSFEALTEAGMQFVDDESDILEQIIKKEEQLEKRRLLTHLQDAVHCLNAQQQKIIRMVFYENKSHSEIGQAFGVSKQAIHQQLKTILKKLKTFF